MKNARTKPNRSYHHGDLREALIRAARRAIDKVGPDAIMLKALALEVGVTQSAPYRHFASREAVLEAVATDGFERFRAALQVAEGDGSFDSAFERTAMAYVGFGRTNPGVYRLMFASKEICAAAPQSPLASASAAAFHDLLKRVGTRSSPERARAVAMWIWSTLHGIVMLEAEGLLRGPDGGHTKAEDIVQELAESVRIRLGASAEPPQRLRGAGSAKRARS